LAGSAAISISRIAPPARLIIDRMKLQYPPRRKGSLLVPLSGRFHVSTAKGCSVSGAIVYGLGLPPNLRTNAQEARTNAAGWATIMFCAADLRDAKRQLHRHLRSCS
jgi:hypothetical protein